MAASTTPSLRDRVQELLNDSEAEIASIDARRQALIDERDAEIAAVRDRFASQLSELDEELKTAQRLRRALEPPAPRGPRKKSKGLDWSPSDKSIDMVLKAMADTDKEIVSDLAKACGVSSTTVKNALDHLRDSQMVRLAGKTSRNAKRYRLTPQGQARADELTRGAADGG